MIERRSRRNAEPLACPLHQHAAPIQRIDLAARQIQFTQPIQRPCNGRFGDIQIRRQATDGVSAVVQVAGQKHAQLAGGQISAIPADQRDNRVAQEADLGIRNWVWERCHV